MQFKNTEKQINKQKTQTNFNYRMSTETDKNLFKRSI